MDINQISLITLWVISLALPYLVFAIHNSFRRKRTIFFRALIAVGAGWLFLIAYAKATGAIYRALASSPAQIEALNNSSDVTLSSAIFFGWMLPSIIVGASWVIHAQVLPRMASSSPHAVAGTRLWHAPFFYVRQMAGAFGPSAVRQIIRWCVLLAFVYLACWQLMRIILNVIFRYWQFVNISDQDTIWMNLLALGHLLFALGALFTGIGLFRGILTFPKVGRGALVLLAIGLLLIATSFIGYFYMKNRCSHQGGTWVNDTMQCTENSRSLYEIRGQ